MKRVISMCVAVLVIAAMTMCMGGVAQAEETSFLQEACSSITTSIANRFPTAAATQMVDGDKATCYKSALTRAAEAQDLTIDMKLNAVYRIDTVKFFERYFKMGSCCTAIDVYVGNTVTGTTNWSLVSEGTKPNTGTTDGACVETAISVAESAPTGSALRLVLHGNNIDTTSTESLYQIYELEAYGAKVSDLPSNICLNRPAETNIASGNSLLPVKALTDGSYSDQNMGSYYDRFVSAAAQKALTVEIALDGVYNISWAEAAIRSLGPNDVRCDYVTVEVGKKSAAGITWQTANEQTAMQNGAAGTYVVTSIPFASSAEGDMLRLTFSRNDYSTAKAYEIAEVMAYGTYVGEGYVGKNILQAAHTQTNHTAIDSALTEKNLTDGDTNTRYASSLNVTAPLVVDFALDGRYDITKFKIYKRFDEQNTGTTGDAVKILCGVTGANGVVQWTTAADGKLADRKGSNGSVEASEFALTSPVTAEMVRITLTMPEGARQYQFPEIEAFGDKQADVAIKRLSGVSFRQGETVTEACPVNGSFTAFASYEGIDSAAAVFMLYNDKGNLIDVAVDTGNGAAFNIAEDTVVKKIRILTFESMQTLRPILLNWRTTYYR